MFFGGKKVGKIGSKGSKVTPISGKESSTPHVEQIERTNPFQATLDGGVGALESFQGLSSIESGKRVDMIRQLATTNGLSLDQVANLRAISACLVPLALSEKCKKEIIQHLADDPSFREKNLSGEKIDIKRLISQFDKTGLPRK
ncbi:hypothetical protein KKA47_07395 [bacterium]|nr:hypothetical protein [bacterium]